MELPNRVTWIENGPGRGLLAADVTGRLHLLDEQLQLVRSSPASANARPATGAPIYTMAVTDEWVVTKDKMGTIVRWSLETLDPIDVLDPWVTCNRAELEEEEEPSPVISRGIAVLDGKVYVNNGYRQIAIIDLARFAVDKIVPSFAGDSSVESFCLDGPDLHVISNQGGRLFFGDLAKLSFPQVVGLECGNVHQICYDKLHKRFWATLEESTDQETAVSNGLVVLKEDGTIVHRLLFAMDDVEMLAFSHDYRRAYVGGFEGVLQVIDNTAEKPKIVRTIHGFPHQIISMAVMADDSLAVLSQDGELLRITADGDVLTRADWRRQCAWDIQPSLEQESTYYVATDDGVVHLELAESSLGPYLRTIGHHITGLGFTRRLQALSDGYLTISRDRKATRYSGAGDVRWQQQLDALCNTVSVSPDRSRVMVATNAGGVELDARTGDHLDFLELEGRQPAWAATYLDDGNRVLFGRNGALRGFAADSHEIVWRMELDDYVKRAWTRGEHLWVAGADGVKQIPLYGDKVERHFNEMLSNTVENAVVVDGLVCAVSYGMQLAAYDLDTGELVGLMEDMPDFAKAMVVVRDSNDQGLVVIGSRGGTLALYRLDAGPEMGTFVKLRELHLPRAGVSDVQLTAVEA